MAKTPMDYPETMTSAESGRPMVRGEKLVSLKVDGKNFEYRQGIAKGEAFPPVLIRAIRLRCGLSQRDAGELFGTGAKSFEKYEAGQIPPSKPTQRLLRLAMERPDLFAKPSRGEVEAADVRPIQDTIREARLDRIYAPLFRDRTSDVAA